MLVLAIEVYYYKREARKGKESTNNNITPSLVTTIQPFEGYEHSKSVVKQNNILLGHGDFLPARNRNFKYSFQN